MNPIHDESLVSHYTGLRVLVTGADGFIGSHLAETLLGLGARVTAFVRGTARAGAGVWDFRCLEARSEQFETVIAGDIASSDSILRIADCAPDVIFHLAAIAYVDYSFRCPAEVFRVNAGGTVNVLEVARRLPGLRRLVVTSSSEVYGTCLTDAIDETHPLNPTSPYAASKLAADRMAWAYRSTYGLPVTILRPFNTYGPRHAYDVIPKFIRLALEGLPLTVHGDGSQARDFSYISDTIHGFLLAGSRPGAEGEVFNIGSGKEVTVRRLAETIIRLSGSPSEIVHDSERAAEVQRLRADTSKAHAVLGFESRVSIEDGLRENIEWERRRRAGRPTHPNPSTARE
jgi:nucleoside-diphosphate-sugar epimerase